MAFSSKDHLDAWLRRRNIAEGYTMPIQTCWELAQKWYAGRLEHDWQRPDQNKTQQLFHSLGLKGDF
ncbi:MAG: organomercurial lyase [Desulfobacterales bacterium]